MTISTLYEPSVYAGNGSLVTFGIDFPFLSNSSFIKVSLKDDATGEITVQTGGGTHYTVTGSNVVFTSAPASGKTVIIELNPDFTQQDDYKENEAFPAETLERGFDTRTLESQLNRDLIDRSIKVDSSISGFSTSFDPTSGADKYLKINSAGDRLETFALVAGGGLGNIKEDTSPQLGATLDTNGFDITFDNGKGIRDDSGNEQLLFNKAPSAVNYLAISNSSAPKLGAEGSDTNVSLELESKGSGNIKLDPGSTGDVEVEGGSILLGTGEGLRDAAGNEQLSLVETASAVNHIEITNNSTGNAPKIASAGDDTNISLQINAKGNASVALSSRDAVLIRDLTDTNSGEIRLVEKLSNGNNYVGLRSPASVSSNLTFTLPSADGSSGAMITTNGSGVLGFSPAILPATEAQQKTGTDLSSYVTPGRQMFNKSAVKAFVTFNGTGTPAILQSLNVSSITDLGVGNYTINMSISLANTNYAVIGTSSHSLGSTSIFQNQDGVKAVNSFSIFILNAAGTLQDRDFISLIVVGDI